MAVLQPASTTPVDVHRPALETRDSASVHGCARRTRRIARLLAGRGVPGQGAVQLAELALIEFVVPPACPRMCQVALVRRRLADIREILLGVKQIDDLDSVGKCSSARFQIHLPVAGNRLACGTVETAPFRSRSTRAANALGTESVSRCAALSIAAEYVTDPLSRSGRPLFGSRPSALQTVTSLTSRVLVNRRVACPGDFEASLRIGTRCHPSEVELGGSARLRPSRRALARRRISARVPRRALDLLGVHRDARQLVHQLAALHELTIAADTPPCV